MDKQIYTTRQKITADDMNQDITDSENGINKVVNDAIFSNDTILTTTGLIATGDGSDTISVSAGRAWHATTGKEVDVPVSVNLSWDGTDGKIADPSSNRVDLVCVKHDYLDGSTQSRLFIDNDTTSATYGQAITSSVVINKDDYYDFVVVSGTTSSPTSVPFVPSGTIPLFTVAITAGGTTAITQGNINNNAFRSYKSEVISSLQDVANIFSCDTGWKAITAVNGNEQNIYSAKTSLSPNLLLTVRNAAGTDYLTPIVSGTVSNPNYSARYEPSTGYIWVRNWTAESDRSARVLLIN